MSYFIKIIISIKRKDMKNKMKVMGAVLILVGMLGGIAPVSAQYVEPYSSDSYSLDYWAKSYDDSSYDTTSYKTASSTNTSASVTCNSATLYGEVWTNGTPTTVWFEWGTSTSLGNATPSQTKSTDGQFSRNLSGLSENTTYFYRAMAANQYGSSTGSTLSFTTKTCTSPTPTPAPTPAPSSCFDDASVTLSGPSSLNPGATGTFHATVRNTGSSWWYHGSAYQFVQRSSLNISPSYGHLAFRVDPNDTHSWSFSVTAPTSPGTYTLKMQNVHRAGWDFKRNDGTGTCREAGSSDSFFGDIGSASFTVTSTTTTPPPPSGGDSGDDNDINIITDNSDSNIINESDNSNIVEGNTDSNININSNNTTNINTTINGNDNGDDDDDNDDNDDEPDVSTRSATNITETAATLRGEVDGNGRSTRVWFEYSDDRDDIASDEETDEENVGSGNETFSERVTGLRRNTTYYFRAIAENSEGIDRGAILSFRTGEDDDGFNDDDFDAPTAVTTPATGIGSTSAVLNSLILTSDNNTDTWFEWGPTPSLGRTTSAIRVPSSSFRHAAAITGLAPNTTYFFRAVAENDDWRNVGVSLAFTTTSGSVAGTSTVVRNTTIVNRTTGDDSLVMLTLDCGSEFITENERRECLVKWDNTSGVTLRDVVLQVLLPKRMSFEAASDGDIENDENTLAFDIGTLRTDDDGELAFIMRTDSVIEDEGLMVVVAQMVYTDPDGVTGDALAYSSHRTYSDGSALGAFALGAGFLPDTLFGWLLLIILILLLLVLARQFANSSRPRDQVIITPPPQH